MGRERVLIWERGELLDGAGVDKSRQAGRQAGQAGWQRNAGPMQRRWEGSGGRRCRTQHGAGPLDHWTRPMFLWRRGNAATQLEHSVSVLRRHDPRPAGLTGQATAALLPCSAGIWLLASFIVSYECPTILPRLGTATAQSSVRLIGLFLRLAAHCGGSSGSGSGIGSGSVKARPACGGDPP